MAFRLEEVTGGFLLFSEADDRSVYADTWHETLDEARQVALEEYGLDENDWSSGVN
jgi:hypothetical protein